MNTTTLLTFLTALCAATSYNLGDPVLNQFLDTKLQYLSHFHDRQARDVNHHGRNDNCERPHPQSMTCCGNATRLPDNGVEDMNNVIDCLSEMSNSSGQANPSSIDADPLSCENILRKTEQITCVVECMSKKKNIVDNAGNPNEDVVKEETKKKFTEDWKQQLAEDAVTKCLADLKATETAAKPGQCNPAAIKLSQCVWKEIELKCPADRQVNSKLCTFIREEIKKMNNDD